MLRTFFYLCRTTLWICDSEGPRFPVDLDHRVTATLPLQNVEGSKRALAHSERRKYN